MIEAYKEALTYLGQDGNDIQLSEIIKEINTKMSYKKIQNEKDA